MRLSQLAQFVNENLVGRTITLKEGMEFGDAHRLSRALGFDIIMPHTLKEGFEYELIGVPKSYIDQCVTGNDVEVKSNEDIANVALGVKIPSDENAFQREFAADMCFVEGFLPVPVNAVDIDLIQLYKESV